MKKLMIAAAFVFAAFGVNAQTTAEGFSKGSMFLSGNLGFSSTKYPGGIDDTKVSGFTFSPEFGYFVSNNIAVGIALGISSSKTDYGAFEEKFTGMQVGAFGRYYFTPASRFSMFLNLGANYMTEKYEETGDPDEKYNGFGVGFGPGLHYFISNRLALQTSIGVLGFTSWKPDADGADATTSFDFNVGMQDLTFGLVFKLK